MQRVMSADVKRVARTPSSERISDRVHDELASAIRDLRLKPGELLSESDLSAQLGVSRTPLREAISRLVDQRLLVVVAQVGTSVALINLSEVEEACFIRTALESAAFSQACRDSRRDVTVLRRIWAEQERAVLARDPDAFFNSDESLHEEIFRLSGHLGAWRVVKSSKLQLDRLRRLILPETVATRTLLDEHARIVDLLEIGDIEAGVQLIGVHARHVPDRVPVIRSQYPEYFVS